MSMLPSQPKERVEKHCFVYCGADRCDCITCAPIYIERMKKALDGDFILAPSGMSREEKRDFIIRALVIDKP